MKRTLEEIFTPQRRPLEEIFAEPDVPTATRPKELAPLAEQWLEREPARPDLQWSPDAPPRDLSILPAAKKPSLPGPRFVTTPQDIRPPEKGPKIFEDVRDIWDAAKIMTDPKTPEGRKLLDESIYDRLKWSLTYALSLGGRVGPKSLRGELAAEAEEFGGYGPAVVPAAGQTAQLAFEWGWLYPKLFKAVGLGAETIGRIPKVQRGIMALKRMGGIEKLAKNYPRLYNRVSKTFGAFVKGATVGEITSLAEVPGKDMTAGEVLKHTSKRAGLIGGIAGVFQVVSEVDTALYARKLRNAMIKASNARFSAEIQRIKATPMSKLQKARSMKSLASLKQQELGDIDNIVAAAEAQIRGLKSDKLYQTGQEMVESPQKAAERFVREGFFAKRPYPKGPEALKKGLGKPKGIKMPTTRVGEAIEAVKEIGKRPVPTKPPTMPQIKKPVALKKAVRPLSKAVEPATVVKRHAVEIMPRKQEVLREIDEALKAAPSEQALRTKLQKEIPEPASTLPTEEWSKLIQAKQNRISEEVAKLQEKRIDFEIDGGAEIINTKEALTKFRQGVTALPEKEYRPATKKAAPAKKKPIAAKREKIDKLHKAPEGYFTDGRLLVKGEPPAKAKYVPVSEGAKGISQESVNEILSAETQPAEFQHYAVHSPEFGKGISERPVAEIGEDYEPAVAVFKSGDKYYTYEQNKFNVIRNRYPDVEYGINPQSSALIAYKEGEPVAVLMPILVGEAKEPGTTELPVKLEPLPEAAKPAPPAEVPPELAELSAENLTTIQTSIGQVIIPAAELDVKWDKALEVIFDYGNQTAANKPAQPGLGRSLSMGDTVEYEGKNWLIMPTGWQDVSQLSPKQIDKLVGEAKIPVPPKPTVTEQPSEFYPSGPPPTNIKNVVVTEFREWPKEIKKVGQDYWTEVMAAAKQFATPYRYKALRQTLLGVFRYKKPAVVVGVELQDVRDALTATHELSHNIDWELSGRKFPSSIKGRFPKSDAKEGALRDELKAVSKILRPDLWAVAEKKASRKRYVSSHPELIADYISYYILDADKVREIAPNVTEAFEARLAEKPQVFETISRLQENRYTGPEEPAVAKHIRETFPLPKEYQPLLLNVELESDDFVKAAEEAGIQTARNYKRLMHRARQQAERIDKLVRNKERQTDLVVLVEGGKKNPWTGRTLDDIRKEKLTEQERKAIDLFRAYQEQARQTVNKYLRGADIAEYISFIEDYFIHAYRTPLTEKYKSAITRWAKRSPQAKKRVLPDLDTAVEIGLKPRAKTLSEGLKLWAGINYRVATNLAFLRTLPKITNDDGVSILQKPQDFPSWPTVDYWPIRQTYAKPLKGRGILLFQGRVAVDPRIKPFLDAMFDRPFTSRIIRIIEGLNATWKAFELTLFSLFHHFEEFFSATGSLGPRALPFVGGYYGKRAQVFGKKKLFGFLPAHIGVLKAGKQLEKVPEFMDDYLAHGGQTGYITTEGINLMSRMLKAVEDYLKNIVQTKPVLGKAVWLPYVPAKTVRATYDWWQHILWDNVQRAKLVTYYTIVADGAKNSSLPIKEIKQVATKYTEDNFGGREWMNGMFRNPKVRQFFTQLFMSWDWTLSQIRTGMWPFRYGGKTAQERARRKLMRKIGRHHWFWYLSAIAGFSIAGSYAMSGKSPSENEKGHKLDIDWTKVWRSLPWNKNWETRGDYAHRYIGLGKAGRELVRWVTSPLRAFGYKMSPVARSLVEQGTGYSVGSTWAEPWAKEDLELYQEIYARFKHLMDNFKPFSLSGNNAFLAFPSRKGMTQWRAVQSYKEIYKAKAVIATGGLAAKLTQASSILKANETKLMKDISEACELNRVDSEKARGTAMSHVRSKYYRLFWNAAKKQDIDKCNRFAGALLELGVRPTGLKQSLRSRKERLSPEARKLGTKLFRKARGRR